MHKCSQSAVHLLLLCLYNSNTCPFGGWTALHITIVHGSTGSEKHFTQTLKQCNISGIDTSIMMISLQSIEECVIQSIGVRVRERVRVLMFRRMCMCTSLQVYVYRYWSLPVCVCVEVYRCMCMCRCIRHRGSGVSFESPLNFAIFFLDFFFSFSVFLRSARVRRYTITALARVNGIASTSRISACGNERAMGPPTAHAQIANKLPLL